jgi:hypothetical protein
VSEREKNVHFDNENNNKEKEERKKCLASKHERASMIKCERGLHLPLCIIASLNE